MSPLAFQTCRLREDTAGAFRMDDSGFGFESADGREQLLARGHYEHRLVNLAEPDFESGEQFIAAFPLSSEGSPVLELDERGNPIPGSENSLRAVELAEEMLGQERAAPDEARGRIREIWGLLDESDARLSELLFERLYRWGKATGLEGELPEVFWLLPWGDFLAHMRRLDLLMTRDKLRYPHPDPALDVELPELSHLFRYLSVGFAPALRELTEWRDPDAPLEPRLVGAFTRRLQRISKRQLPETVWKPLSAATEAIGRWAQVQLWAPSDARDHMAKAQVIVDVYEFLLAMDAPFKGSVENGRIKWMGRIAIAAQAGGYPTSRLRMRQATADLLVEVAGDPPPDLAGNMEPIKAHEEADRFFDRAFVVYFGALTALRVRREPELAFARAHASRRGFERFELNPLRFRRSNLANVLPRACLVEFEGAFAAGKYGAAEEALLSLEETLQRGNTLKPFTVALLRAELLLNARALIEESDEPCERLASKLGTTDGERLLEEALRICKEVFGVSVGNRKAWRLYLGNAETDAAIREIEVALNATRDDADLDKRELNILSWLEYQLASLLRQRAEDIPGAILEAFTLYLRLLGTRQHDLAVLEEVLETFSELEGRQAEEAAQMLAEQLVGFDDHEIPLTHAAARWLILSEAPDDIYGQSGSFALPIVGAGSEDREMVNRAEAILAEEIARSRFVARIVEAVTKWLFDEARAVGDSAQMRAAGRLLKPATEAHPQDAIWWTRRASIAITERDHAVSEMLMEEIPAFLRKDAIAHFQKARLLLTAGNLAGADEELIEASFLDRESTGEELPNAAILDRRGFIALREGRYDDAISLYRSILSDNGADPNAHYGLGRVYLESPRASADMVLDEWRQVLRLQSPASSTSQHFAWRAAAGIAGLVHREVSVDPAAASTSRLLEEMRGLVMVEDMASSRCVIDALRVRGVIDRHTADIVRQVRKQGLSRSVAQYLMARAIHVYIEEPERWGAFVDGELYADVLRCREHGVLGDFLAGAKGSYARAQMRVGIQRRPRRAPDTIPTKPVGAKKLRKLIEHVVTTGRSASYYSDAYRYIHAAEGAPDDQLVSAACEIIARMAAGDEGGAAGRGPDDLLASLRPHIGLETISDALDLSGSPKVAGYVDVDALLYAKVTKDLGDWELHGASIVSRKPVDVSLQARRGYARAGLDWIGENGDGYYCYVNLIHPGSGARAGGVEVTEEDLSVFA